MQDAAFLDQAIINDLKQHTSIFAYSHKELNALALGISQGLALAGLNSPLLDLAIASDNVPLMVAGGMSVKLDIDTDSHNHAI